MKDKLSASVPKNETAIVNLDISKGSDTYWACCKTLGETDYLDSFGNWSPLKELHQHV